MPSPKLVKTEDLYAAIPTSRQNSMSIGELATTLTKSPKHVQIAMDNLFDACDQGSFRGKICNYRRDSGIMAYWIDGKSTDHSSPTIDTKGSQKKENDPRPNSQTLKSNNKNPPNYTRVLPFFPTSESEATTSDEIGKRAGVEGKKLIYAIKSLKRAVDEGTLPGVIHTLDNQVGGDKRRKRYWYETEANPIVTVKRRSGIQVGEMFDFFIALKNQGVLVDLNATLLLNGLEINISNKDLDH